MGAIEEKKLKSEIELARAQTIKFQAEAGSLRRPNLINWIGLITGFSALMTALFGAYLQWKQSDAAIAQAKAEIAEARSTVAVARAEAQEKINAADQKTYKAERSISETEDRKKVLVAQVEALQNQIELIRKETEKRQQTLNEAAQATSDPNAKKVLKQAASDAGSLASSINSNQPVTLNFRGGITSPMMEQLRSQFRTSGYPATKLLPRVRDREITNEVLYYQKEDEADAQNVAAIAAGFFDGKCNIPREIPVRFRELKDPPDRIELFVYGNC